jgi:hypothetical protein
MITKPNIKAKEINTVRYIATSLCFTHERVSVIKDDLLKATIRVCTPLVEKNKAKTKPKDNNFEFWFFTMSNKVVLTAA